MARERGLDLTLWAARRPAVRDGLIVAGLLFTVYLFAVVGPQAGSVGFDAFAYWNLRIEDPYAIPHGDLGAFAYTPAAARMFAPAAVLSWPDFLWLWLALLVGTVVWLGGRRWWLALLAFPPVAIELYHGNVHLLIAAAIALGFRYPAAWVFVAITKVTPAIGLLWFAARREWGRLAIALVGSAAVVAISLVLDFGLWETWIRDDVLVSLRQAPNQPHIAIPLLVRLPIAAGLVIWGARTDRKWAVPVAAAISMPVLWLAAFSVLAALPALNRPELGAQPTTPVQSDARKESLPADSPA